MFSCPSCFREVVWCISLPKQVLFFNNSFIVHEFEKMPPMTKLVNGFWGPPTSTLDWCEENYAVSQFVAEFWNTISNWIMIVPPLLGAILTWQTRHETRYMLAFLSLFVVGVGSFSFHATLLYHMQLLDELPMIYCTCVFLFCIFECASQPGHTNIRLIFSLTACSMLITIVYLTFVNPLVFQWAYGILAGSLTLLALYKLRQHRGSRKLLMISIISYGSGFILWNFENNFCPTVRDLRTKSIIPLQPLTQLHAIWHLLAGIGSYYHILYSFDLRMRCRGKHTTVKFAWNWLPFIYPTERNLDEKLCETVVVVNGKGAHSVSLS
ncbi:alkaline ceramidase 3 isoform X2 [Nematostella vectensis]|uniref:alkaline ceramidase 3 isoform X2 n=1 Tax=Nematostella vectensis TaxID=45351 RepID=UPI0020774EE1|nr:alkaline ceramidase 3 isoform X2 [Nematostella vectensis]